MASEDYSSMMYVPEVKPETDEENVEVCESSDPHVHHGCDNTVRICLAHNRSPCVMIGLAADFDFQQLFSSFLDKQQQIR